MANVHNVNIDRIKARAKSNGITLKYLCDCIGKPRGFLSVVRSGRDYVDDRELAIIAAKINTTVEYLTDQTDDPEPPKAAAKGQPLTAEQAALIEQVRSLSAEDVRRVADIVSYVISKRDQK